MVPAEFLIPSLLAAQATRMIEEESIKRRLEELMGLEHDRFLAQYHQSVEKSQQKAWHDLHVKRKEFDKGDLVLLYDSKYQKHPGKLQMHWLGPFTVADIRKTGAVQLAQLDGTLREGWVNSARLKPFTPRTHMRY